MRFTNTSGIKVATLSIFLGAFFACQTNSKQMQELSKEADEPGVSSKKVAWLYTKKGKPSYKLITPFVQRFEDAEPYVEFPVGLELRSYGEQGAENAFLSAEYAIQFVNEHKVEAKGSVILKNNKGEALETEHLIWDELNEQIYTEEFVKITKEDQVIMGEGFLSDIYFNEYSLKKSRGIINLEQSE